MNRRAAVFLSLLGAIAAIEPVLAQNHISNVLQGQWVDNSPHAQVNCEEGMVFRPDGTQTFFSGGQILEGVYQVAASNSANFYYRWTASTTKANNLPDCDGNVSMGHERGVFFSRFADDGTSMWLCLDESGQHCHGPWRRITPSH